MIRGLFLFVAMLGWGLAHAGEETNKREEGADCREEFHKLCGNTAAGEGRIHDCIEKNMSSFSPKCQERAKLRAENFAKMKACREEIKKLCGNVEKGEGRKKKCIEENKAKLSPECQQLGERMKEHFHKKNAIHKKHAKEKGSDSK